MHEKQSDAYRDGENVEFSIEWTTNLVSQTSFFASKRISTQLFSSANNGAIGKAATKMVINPNCKTKEHQYLQRISFTSSRLPISRYSSNKPPNSLRLKSSSHRVVQRVFGIDSCQRWYSARIFLQTSANEKEKKRKLSNIRPHDFLQIGSGLFT